MRRADFSYPLPEELIADRPLPRRGASRLLALDGASGAVRDLAFDDLGSLLRPGDLLVLNDTRVLPARLRGRKASGGACEILLERILGGRRFLAQGRASKGFAAGTRIALPADASAVVVARRGEFHEFELDREALPYFEGHGSIPLPPYVAREADQADRERYQTVYAAVPGAVAAPTAGLHFTDELLKQLDAAGVEKTFVTLHVGIGTFRPVTADTLDRHVMHSESYTLSADAAGMLNRAKRDGRRIIAVGTTSARVLESQPADEAFVERTAETSIFIYPPYEWRHVGALITNFHLPRSTLIALIAAMVGLDEQRRIYRAAIEERYRFFSYGDAMLIE